MNYSVLELWILLMRSEPRCYQLPTFCVVLVMLLASSGQVARAAEPEGAAKHVIVIGVDGLAPFGISSANTPALDRLCEQGASTMHARAVMPTSSSSNWASMIMGAGPEQHGITSNEWERNRFEIAPVVKGSEGIYPTMFSAVRKGLPTSAIGVFHDWGGFGRLVESESCDLVVDADGPVDAIDRSTEFWNSRNPSLLFIHLDHVDHAGHAEGWGSPDYVQAVQLADRLINQVVTVVEKTGHKSDTVVIVTSDHGGVDKGHGGSTMAEIEIPWIAWGAGIRTGVELKKPVNTYDTAATVLRLLDVPAPACWVGRPVTEALSQSKQSEDDAAPSEPVAVE
ncbi:alkaline phosphatase [Aeoliella mucimassa]|nr:alkaline phosphatase [Aeoliella mucimassa]